MKNKKFIVVQDQITANKLLGSGFDLISKKNGTFLFINQIPQNFNFNEVDVAKLAYTNILSL